MTDRSFLTFSLQGLLLAVEAVAVREIIRLPELALAEECPAYIAGMADIRGKIMPVMDLSARLGHPAQGYGCSDKVIVLGLPELATEVAGQLSPLPALSSHIVPMGIIVNDVHDVVDIPEGDIGPPPCETAQSRAQGRFVSGKVRYGDEIFMVLDPLKTLDINSPVSETAPGAYTARSASGYFCAQATTEERETFRRRAAKLRRVAGGGDAGRVLPAVVISLNGEGLCVELDSVREFSALRNFTPVPCCPRHIAGNMNLRGNVLTLIDIRGLLNAQAGKISETSKIIVADAGDFPAGIIVDEILDVINLRAEDIVAVPSTMKAANDKFVKGAVPFGGGLMALLDLKAILSWEGLIVNEDA